MNAVYRRLAKTMRAAGIEELQLDELGNPLRIRLSPYPPEPKEREPKFDPDPEVNRVHAAAYRKKRELEQQAAERASADEVRFAATEGVRE